MLRGSGHFYKGDGIFFGATFISGTTRMADHLKGLKTLFSVILEDETKKVQGKWVFYLTVISFLIRVPLLIYPEVIHNDTTEYIRHARRILSWNWSPGRAHPLYPAMIALAHFLTPSDEIAGILVSAVFGALIVLPVYYLGKEIFSEKVGLVAAVLAIFQPFLYMSSGSVLTESIFHFLVAVSCLFGWRAFKRGGFLDAFLFGLCTAFSYLTRPEGIGFLLIFSAWILLVNPPDVKRGWAKRGSILLVGVLGFFVLSGPYLLQLRAETGKWQVSKKIAMSMGSLSDEGGDLPIDQIRVKKRMTVSTFLKSPLAVAGKMARGFLKSLYIFQQVYTQLLSLLLILGLVLGSRKLFSLRGNLYLVSYVVYFFGFVHPFFWVTRRYTSHVVSICLPWAAIGLLEMGDRVRRRYAGKPLETRVPAIFLLTVILVIFAQGRVIHTREHRHIQRDVGLWMRENLPKDKVMSGLPQEAFYAEMPWMKIPRVSYEQALAAARSKGVRYLIVDENIEEDYPGFSKAIREEDLVPVKEWKRKDQHSVIYRIVPKETKP
jgi:4-amino-4-deoxy-L-arabinose transferase-like glycosyltransferase